jgi:TPR repeat protein
MAQSNLGAMYYGGQGVVQDYIEAVKWFRLGAAQGDASAQYNLGVMYGKGLGVVQDYVIAHMWFNLAGAQGYKDAIKSREAAETAMTAQQIAEAQKLARECLAIKYKGC